MSAVARLRCNAQPARGLRMTPRGDAPVGCPARGHRSAALLLVPTCAGVLVTLACPLGGIRRVILPLKRR